MTNKGIGQLYLCYSINDFFAREAGISLTGFFENNPDYEPEEVFILNYGVCAVNKKLLDGIAMRYGKHITYLNAKPVTSQVKRDYPQLKGWRGTMAPNAKAFIDMIMPDYVERLLFIDADTVVAGSVAELNSLDMGGAVLGVVPASMSEDAFRKGRVKLESGNQIYFNSGVLLYDLVNWRRENCHQMIIDTLNKNVDLEFPDQSLLNNAIPERLLKLLPPKYNYLTHYYHPLQERQRLRLGNHFSEEEIEEAIRRPAIVHYLGGWVMARPWFEECRSSHAAEYLHYKALSPWKDTPLSPSYIKVNPPKGFRNRVILWQMKQYSRQRSYRVACVLDAVGNTLISTMNKLDKWKEAFRSHFFV